MIFLLVLVVATLLVAAVPPRSGIRSARRAARLGMAAAMVFAGASHWFMPTPFVQHLPPWVPAAEALIVITGFVEVALGAALLLQQPWRRGTGLALAAYLVSVFPANVYVAVADVDIEGQPGGWYAWLRLPLQALFVAWALWSTEWSIRQLRAPRQTLVGAEPSPRPPSRAPATYAQDNRS
jgi:uncharacterized membrane protein